MYGTKDRDGLWQKRLRDIPLMRWLVEARNKIEKQGDLEAESFVRAEIIASHLDEGPRVEVPTRLFEGPEVLLRRIPAGAVAEHVREHGTLKIERRWVESDLPEFELLDALATAYGHLSELVADAHRQMGLAPPRTENHETGERFDAATLGWRLPCMIGHDQPRGLLLSLSDGSRISFESKHREIDLAGAEEKLAERYGASGIEVLRNAFSGGREGVPKNLFDAARTAFLRDGYHLPFLFLLRDYKPVKILVTPTENRAQKYLQMRHLAAEVVRYGADAAISIGEAWMAPLAEIKGYQSPSEVPTRKETLRLVMVGKSGEPVQYMAMIERDGGNVFLGETFVTRGQPVWAFAPFYQAWGRPIAESWTAGFHDAVTDCAPNKVSPQGAVKRSNFLARSAHLLRPPRNGPCLCGSGLKFKRCCADRLRDELDYDARMRAFLKERKFKDALYTCRAYVTQYTIWHKSHTEPAIRAGMPKKGSILEIDIRALAEIVDSLMFCYIKTEMMDEFPAVLERLRSNINDPDWQRKITYFHVLHALWPDWDRRAGRREMKRLGSVADDKDEEILQLYLDLYSNNLSFSSQQDFNRSNSC